MPGPARQRRRTEPSSATRATTPGPGRSRRSASWAWASAGPGRYWARRLSPLATGEQPLARQLLAKLAPGDLLLADRNFLSRDLLAEVLAAGVHVLWRAKSDVDLPVLDVLEDGTYLSRIADPAASRKMRRRKGGADPRDIPGIAVRVIEYSVTSEDGAETSETFTLVTDITDPACCPASRPPRPTPPAGSWRPASMSWRPRIRGGAAVVLRSKSPPMIRQEIYAMLCCYQAVRVLISDAAGDAGIDPRRVSFTAPARGSAPHQRSGILFPLRT